jgi:hypothetical protein
MSLTGNKSRRIILKPRSSLATPQVLLWWCNKGGGFYAVQKSPPVSISHRCFTSQMLRFGLPRLEPDPLPGKKCCSNARTPIASSVAP